MNKMKKGLTALFAIAVIIASSSKAKAQSCVPMGPGMIYSADYKGAGVVLQRFGTFAFWCFARMGANLIVEQHFPDEIYVDEFGRLHLPEGATLKDLETGEDVTWEFRMEEEMDFQFGD